MPAMFFWERRISGGTGNVRTCSEACALWQSTQVAWRLLLSNTPSAASWALVEEGIGWPTLGDAYSGAMLALRFIPETLVEPLWQTRQSCSSAPRSNRAGPAALCGVWQEMQASAATLG